MKKTFAAMCAVALCVVVAWGQDAPKPPAKSAAKPGPVPRGKLLPRFPDFGALPSPAEYQGRIFKLSQDYPQTKPELEPAVRKILAIDFTKDWKKYMLAVRDYIYEGNIEADEYNGVPTTADDTIAWAKSLQVKFPGLFFVIEAILVEDEKVALRWRMNVTDPATGKKGYVSGTNILVFVSGQALTNDQGGGDQFIPLPPS